MRVRFPVKKKEEKTKKKGRRRREKKAKDGQNRSRFTRSSGLELDLRGVVGCILDLRRSSGVDLDL